MKRSLVALAAVSLLSSCSPKKPKDPAPEPTPEPVAEPVTMATPTPTPTPPPTPEATPTPSGPLTLRSLGAKGDGTTNDTAAVIAALLKAEGNPVDGEGLTYAVHGTMRIDGPVNLKNATFLQTMGSVDTSKYIRSAGNTNPPPGITPADGLRSMVDGLPIMTAAAIASYPEDPVLTGDDLDEVVKMLHVRTFFVLGDGAPVAVNLENIKILRGDHADGGMHTNSGGMVLQNASPVTLKNVEITGAGKGNALFIYQCADVKIDGLNIHDILWAPYRGDVAFSSAFMDQNRAWNDMPIYDFDENRKQFIRVRIQEQVNGLTLADSMNVEMINSRIDRIGAMVDGKFYAWQADGMTVSGVQNFVMKDCEISNVWEGIDFTGHGVDGFVQENIKITDTFAYGFKYAHPQKNGKVINCVSIRAGLTGFTIGEKSENIEFINCKALETGYDSHWVQPGGSQGIAGFKVEGKNIVLRDCVAENTEHPGLMAYGFSVPAVRSGADFGNRLINARGSGAQLQLTENYQLFE